MDKCETTKCNNKPTKIVFWPGSTKLFCNECEEKAKNVANAMGFNLTTEDLKQTE